MRRYVWCNAECAVDTAHRARRCRRRRSRARSTKVATRRWCPNRALSPSPSSPQPPQPAGSFSHIARARVANAYVVRARSGSGTPRVLNSGAHDTRAKVTLRTPVARIDSAHGTNHANHARASRARSDAHMPHLHLALASECRRQSNEFRCTRVHPADRCLLVQ